MTVFPDVEALAIRFLRGVLPPSVRFGTEVPEDYEGATPFVGLRRMGGFVQWPALDVATVDVDVYADSREGAHDLAQAVRSALLNSRYYRGPFARVVLTNGPVWAPDDLSELPRWVVTFQISTRPERKSL